MSLKFSHWHGATATAATAPIAIAEALDGKVGDSMEQVSDDQSNEGAPPSKQKRGEDIMKKRRLGKSNLEVSAIGLGCMAMSFGYKRLSSK